MVDTARPRIRLAAQQAFMRGLQLRIFIGDTFLSDARSIGKYRAIAGSLSPAVVVRPFGHEKGQTSDHLHLDLGYASLTPRECTEAS